MYPNTPNIELELLTIDLIINDIGTSSYKLRNFKKVIGISFSISARQYYDSHRADIKIDLAVKILSFIYDNAMFISIKDEIYKVQRTYLSGQYIELYLASSKIKKGDIIGYT